MQKISQQQIADQLGLCRTTVSRCFAPRSKINPETRAQVLELAAKLGYHYKPQRSPRAMARRKAAEIGVLIGTRRDMRGLPLPSQPLLKGITERAASLGLPLNVRYIDPAELDARLQANLTPVGLRRGDDAWDGAILIFPFTESSVAALSRNLPAVSIAEDYTEAKIDSIDADQHTGIYELISHLSALGHRRIGFSTWQYSVEAPWSYRRFGAYVESLYRHGLDFDPQLALNLNKNENLPPEALAERVAHLVRKGATAWVCGADHQAHRLISDLRKHAIRVPEDCSVTGFDGTQTPAGLPPLTTIKVPYEEMGATAVARLIDRIENPTTNRRHNLVEGKLTLGASTQAPPNK